MSASNPSSPSRFPGLKSYISRQNLRAFIPTRRALRPGEFGYIDGETTTQSWSHWAHRKITRNGFDATSVDEVTLFPGWASLTPCAHEHGNAFKLRIHVSGFATTRRSPEFLTRSQRAFLRLAKGYASLPKLQSPARGASMIDVDGLHLPPRPDEIADDFEMEELNKKFEHMRHAQAFQSSEDSYDESDPHPSSLRVSYDASTKLANTLLQKQHRNLEARLRPFWSSVLSYRTVQIRIFVAPAPPDSVNSKLDTHQHDLLLTEHMITGPDGAFANAFKIPWETLRKTRLASHRVFDKSDVEHGLLVSAKLLPQFPPTPAHMTPEDIAKPTTLHIPITSSRICVITDIDDTVKHSNISCGARAVFHNVFVKDLEETTIPEMGTWYKSMWERGVRFHYVSNSPVELLPVIEKFLHISGLPQGSIRLKSYHSRSFFSGLLSDPATRKRANIVEVLDGFPDSKFILIGDSGEQDLELYAAIASERPTQILAVFIRDVWDTGIANPTNGMPFFTPSPVKNKSMPQTSMDHPHTFRTTSDPSTVTGSGADTSMTITHPTHFVMFPRPISSCENPATPETNPRNSTDSMSSTASISSSSMSQRNSRKGTGQTTLTEAEKKRFELQIRINKARLMMPSHVILRMFGHPAECTETDWLLQPLGEEYAE